MGGKGRIGWFVVAWCATTATLAHGEVTMTASSVNVKEAGSPLTIHLIRWSTEEERSPLLAALSPAPPAAAPSAAAADRGGAARGLAGRARGRGGRGGRGETPLSPMATLTAAISRAPTVGYIWTDGVTGYSIKYAYHSSMPDGGERIILATDRRLGAYSPAWKPVAATPPGGGASVEVAPTDYEFTLIEIRVDAKGTGEGKTSLTTKVIVDNDAKSVALENYPAAPAMLQHVKR